MTMNDVEARLKEIFAVILEIPEDQVVRELSPDICKTWDSLRHIHLMTAIDETFGVALTFEQQMEALTFDLAIEVVQEAMSANGS